MGQKFDLNLLPHVPDFCFEKELWLTGSVRVAGVDEAGRGALAGPVAAGAVIFPPDPSLAPLLLGVRDSKQMTASQRQEWAERLPDLALAWGVGLASNEEIDNLGILPATRLAAERAILGLQSPPQHLLLDFLTLPAVALPQTPLVKGDCRSLSIAAASILAKTARDAWMCQADGLYPEYGFAQHKGYGTAAHRAAIALAGPCPLHRKHFRLLKAEETPTL